MEDRELGLDEQLMIRFGELGRSRLGHISRGELRHGERAVLFCIKFAEHPPVRASELAEELNMSAPGITPILNRLEDMGYIRREMDTRDRRAVHAALTDRGREALERDIAEMRGFFSGLTEHLGEQDCTELLRLFDKIVEYYTQNQL